MNISEQEHKQGDTYKDGHGHRILYDPEWSPSRPWVTFSGGTAGRQFVSLGDAKRYFGGNKWTKS